MSGLITQAAADAAPRCVQGRPAAHHVRREEHAEQAGGEHADEHARAVDQQVVPPTRFETIAGGVRTSMEKLPIGGCLAKKPCRSPLLSASIDGPASSQTEVTQDGAR